MYYVSPIEKKALDAYHRDPIVSSDTDDKQSTDTDENHSKTGVQKKHDCYEGGEIELRSIDEHYDGGGKKKNDVGFFKKLQLGRSGSADESNGIDWYSLTDQQKKQRINALWARARVYTNKIRFFTRLQKEQNKNLNEMMLDDIEVHDDDEAHTLESAQKIPWYLIDTNRPLSKAWELLVAIILTWSLIATPILIVFPCSYSCYLCDLKCDPTDQDCVQKFDETCKEDPTQSLVQQIDLVVDMIFGLDILANFLKRSRQNTTLGSTSFSYITGFFITDALATFPGILSYFFKELKQFQALKLFRNTDLFRILAPLSILFNVILRNQPKKRQNDLSYFFQVLVITFYGSHLLACLWIKLGVSSTCADDSDAFCKVSWTFSEGYEEKPVTTIYIYAYYWIFEVITTVGYGDYSGASIQEHIFTLLLQFIGLTFFSFFNNTINETLNTSDSFDDLIDEKLTQLDVWIKKIEGSNKPFHIQPILYNEMRNGVNDAFQYDFNLLVEEFSFYQELTPQMKTDLIKSIRVFREFEKSFSHFFEECERGFINECIISLYTRIYSAGETVIAYKSDAKEMYFISSGLVEVFNNEDDEIDKEKPVLYMPRYSYFGDYNILLTLKSTCEYRTVECPPDELGISQIPTETIFLCLGNDRLQELNELFPQTAQNLKERAIERRKNVIRQKNTNSKKFEKAMKAQGRVNSEGSYMRMPGDSEEELEDFYSDEEQEDFEQNDLDMESAMEELNKRVDQVASGLKRADELLDERAGQRNQTRGDVTNITSKIGARGGARQLQRSNQKLPSQVFKAAITGQ